MSKKLLFLLVFLISICLVGCSSDVEVSGNQTPTPAAPSTPEITPTPEPTPTPVASIKYFGEDPEDRPDKSPGAAVKLCWEVEGAASLKILPGIGDIEPISLKDCRTVNPERSERYILTATGADNLPATKEHEVKVVQRNAVISEFKVTPETVDYGQKVSIYYRVENAAHVYLSGQDLGDAKEGRRVSFSLFSNARYVLVAENADRVKTKEEVRNVRVNPPAHAQVSEFKSQTPSITQGQGRICYRVSEGSDVRIVNTTANTVAFTSTTKSNGLRNCPQVAANTGNNVYMLQARGPDNQTVNHDKTESILLNPPPGKADIFIGGNKSRLEICYRGVNMASVTIHTLLRVLGESREQSACFPAPPPEETTTYLLDGKDKNNRDVHARMDVSVPRRPEFSITPHPNPGAFWFSYAGNGRSLAIECPGYARPLIGKQGKVALPKSLLLGKPCRLVSTGDHATLKAVTPFVVR